ncbi:hypothetical protein [Xanthomonas sp. XNM01]|uniref:hypothetical protein n=1 Tax=Xanthomonas sp. XNM01 TaxID=2769289 RepID=UPI00177B67BE|nr:hypothetical protein [Xanthomonas sp. XNM01]MBD9368083.1 hypothetical protein [Xanthomonas sp. XNM01]
MNAPRHPLTPEERALADHLDAALDDAMPSAALDARILAQARGAVAGPGAGAAQVHADLPGTDTVRRRGDAARTRPRRRWAAPLGLAASLTLAVGVAWQLREPPRTQTGMIAGHAEEAARPADTAMQEAPAAPQAAPALRSDAATAPEPPATAARPAPPAAARSAPSTATGTGIARPAPAPPATSDAASEPAFVDTLPAPPPAATPAPAAEQRMQDAAPAAARRAGMRAAEARPEAAVAAPAAAPAAMRLRPETTGEVIVTGTALPAPPPAAPVVAADAPAALRTQEQAAADKAQARPAPSRDAHDPADIAGWLERIRQQRDRGDLDGARASLARFVDAHPGHPLPEDLRALR